MIKFYSVGGFLEVGRNMSIIEIDDIAVILDMGLHMDNYVSLTHQEDIQLISFKKLIDHNAIPNINNIKEFNQIKKKIKAIIVSHAHLDHLGAIIFMAKKFNAKIIATPFTIEVLKAIAKDQKIKLKNKLIKINLNGSYKLTKNLIIELLNITHSTPQTAVIVLHTRYGKLIYANDFKIDCYPVLGKKANLERLEKLSGDGDIIALIIDVLYADHYGKTPSESVAQMMLKDVMLSLKSHGLIIVTTFSSHMERISSVIKLSKMIGRKVVVLGRSMDKYIRAAIRAKAVKIPKEIKIYKYTKQMDKILRKINKNKKHYLIICTGGQGEEGSVLRRIADKKFKLNLDNRDHVIFSCSVVPTQANILARKELEDTLEKNKVRIFRDIHVSGHAYREDLRDMIRLIKPKLIIPAHADKSKVAEFVKLAQEEGYKIWDNHKQTFSVKVMKNSQNIELV